MTDDFRAQLALLIECSFCSAPIGEKCDIEGKRKDAGTPYETWLPWWERGVHSTRVHTAEIHMKRLPPLKVAMLLAMAKTE